MPSNVLTIYPGNDNVVTWYFMERVSPVDSETNQFVNNSATVAMTLLDPQGNQVVNAVGLPMTYVDGSEGTYSGVLPYNLTLTVGDGYHLVITAVSGSAHAERRIDVAVVQRTT